jgi:hypothetical protein
MKGLAFNVSFRSEPLSSSYETETKTKFGFVVGVNVSSDAHCKFYAYIFILIRHISFTLNKQHKLRVFEKLALMIIFRYKT